MTTNPCQCFTSESYTIGPDDTPEAPEGEGWPEGTQVYGPCGATTSATFAPGHDAKLKGLLIRLHRQGAEYHYRDGALLISTSPMNHAEKFGWQRFLTDAKPKAEHKPKPKVNEHGDVVNPGNRVPIPRKVPREKLAPVPPKGTVRIGRRRFKCVVDVEHSDAEALTVIYTDPKSADPKQQIVAHVPPKDFTAE
jgi:hypothetical protein